MFDPEAVKRFYHAIDGLEVCESYNPDTPAYRYVKASDYDALLELYRESIATMQGAWELINNGAEIRAKISIGSMLDKQGV